MSSNYYSGRVEKVLFQNRDNAYYVLRMILDDDDGNSIPWAKQSTSVAGNISGTAPTDGTWFGFEAKWVNHPKYGKQLSITRAPVFKGGWDPRTITKLLIGHGVGTTLAKSLEIEHGANLADVLSDTTVLQKSPQVDEATAIWLNSVWVQIKAYHQTVGFLQDLGIPQNKVASVWAHFSDRAEEVLATDPWALLAIPGFTWKLCETIRTKLELPDDSPARLKGAVVASCRDHRGMGNLYTEAKALVHGVSRLTGAEDVKAIIKAINKARKQKLVISEDAGGTKVYYEPWWHHVESESARMLIERLNYWKSAAAKDHVEAYADDLGSVSPEGEALADKGAPLKDIAKAALDNWAQTAHITLSDPQYQGALNALTEPISILTGLPGTGKTQTVRAIMAVLKDAGINSLLLAPTGIAAKRAQQLTGAPAATVHRALKAGHPGDKKSDRKAGYEGVVEDASTEKSVADGSGQEWGYTSKGTQHSASVVIIDESSMIDQALLYRILDGTRIGCRLVFVGDYAQLPSVGPGHVLKEMLDSGIFATVNLKDIYRQAGTSYIVEAAHLIHQGQVPDTQNAEFQLLSCDTDEEALSRCKAVAMKLAGDDTEFQVISPRHGGTVGVTNMNPHLREMLNPRRGGVREKKIGQYSVREGDQVMVVKNDYTKNVYNGDVGVVRKLDPQARKLVLELPGTPKTFVELSFNEVRTYLRLAYCSTVHKNQGREVDEVVLLLCRSFGRQLQRNLLYTAVTRARKRVHIIGQHSALQKAVENARVDERNTLLAYRLKEAIKND